MKIFVLSVTTASLVLFSANQSLAVSVHSNKDLQSAEKPAWQIAQDVEPLVVETPLYVDFPQIVFSLHTPGSKYHLLKVSYSVEASNEESVAALNEMKPNIVDEIHKYLNNTRPEKLAATTGVYLIKEALYSRISKTIEPAEIDDVLIKQFLVQ